MNTPLRRVAMVAMVMTLLLLGNLTYVQVFRADSYRNDSRNQRVLLDEYARQRGQIIAGGEAIAAVKETDDRLEYRRTYADGPIYAPVTGYYSVLYGASGIEQAEDPVLSGSSDQLFVRRLSDMITGRDPRGGSVELTIKPALQRAAYEGLSQRGFTGAVVAMKPETGEILAMASTPSYDPNRLASHQAEVQKQAWEEYTSGDKPLRNRATQATYPPGSSFKLVVSTAALKQGIGPEEQLPADPKITLPGTSNELQNFAAERCGSGETASFAEALARSCNTAFATLAGKVGEDPLRETAQDFGFGESDLRVPLPVAESTVGEIPDEAALYQSGIGQRDVAATPLQDAMVVATIANGGTVMRPQLVKNLLAPDLSVLEGFDADSMGTVAGSDVTGTLTEMMVGAEKRTTGGGKIPGVQIASKTGTAEHSSTPKTTPPHGWYTAFAPADDPQVAVAVLVENGGDRGTAATGASVAAPIGRSVIGAALGKG